MATFWQLSEEEASKVVLWQLRSKRDHKPWKKSLHVHWQPEEGHWSRISFRNQTCNDAQGNMVGTCQLGLGEFPAKIDDGFHFNWSIKMRQLWELELTSSMLAFWQYYCQLCLSRQLVHVFWLANCKGSHQKVAKKMSKSCNKLIKIFVY